MEAGLNEIERVSLEIEPNLEKIKYIKTKNLIWATS